MATDAPLVDRFLLSASWLNVGLYTLELTLSWQYFSRPGRPLTHRMGVGALVLFDTISTLVVCATSYLAVFHGRPAPGDMLLWPLAVNIFLAYSSSAVEQIFMCKIFYLLSAHKSYSSTLLTICVQVGLSFTSAGALLAPGVGPANIKLSLSTNMLGSIYMMGSLNTDIRDTRGFLRRLFILFLSSGIIVAATTLTIMTLLLTGSPAFVLFSSCQGRIYSVTILANLLVGILFHQNTSQPTTTDPASLGSTTIVFSVGAYSDSGGLSGPTNTGTPKSITIHEERISLRNLAPQINRIVNAGPVYE
ncbi:hypothetical protein C8J57DRAFT_1354996 [Mycena rebaudengoi]|nr:hypothetical protein C8J57DRAFT_1354996 [Mycena rebaudengoi]